MTRERRKMLATAARFTLLPAVDTALFNLALLAGYATLALFGSRVDTGTYWEVALYAWLAPPVALYFCGMYGSWDEYAFAKGLDGIISGVAAAVAGLLGVVWLVRDKLDALSAFERDAGGRELMRLVWGFPIRVLVVALVLSPLLIWIWRILANILEYRLLGWSALTRTALVVGDLDRSDVERLAASRRPRYELRGILPATAGHDSPLPCLGGPEKLPEALAGRDVADVFICAASLTRGQLFAAVDACLAGGARPRVALGIYEALISATGSRLQDRLPVYRCKTAGIHGWSMVVKRLLDVTLAGLAVLVAFPFVLLPACLAIVIESKGWPVFSQIRVGQYGRHFKVYKLRTMVVDADARGGPLTEDNDPRITRVGRFLRKTSLDELPQLWNVLNGDMSLVGPRAVVPFVADKFQEWERLSLIVKPGVTGLAQISGRDEIGFREKSLLNLYYVRNHSVWLDLRILFDTVGVVLSMEGTEGTRGAKTGPGGKG